MKPILPGLTLVVAAALLAACGRTHRSSEPAKSEAPPPSTSAVTPPAPGTESPAQASVVAAAELGARRIEWRLTDWDIEADLEANRPIVRTRVWLVGPTGLLGARTIRAAAESRLAADPGLAGLTFMVDANEEGQIELGGTARTVEQVGRAIIRCLETEGVAQVTSRVRLEAPPARP